MCPVCEERLWGVRTVPSVLVQVYTFINSFSAFHPSFAQSWEQKVQDRPLGTHPQVCGPYVDADDTQRKIGGMQNKQEINCLHKGS
ncbi:unnamed protein product [Arctogadus glacialis]